MVVWRLYMFINVKERLQLLGACSASYHWLYFAFNLQRNSRSHKFECDRIKVVYRREGMSSSRFGSCSVRSVLHVYWMQMFSFYTEKMNHSSFWNDIQFQTSSFKFVFRDHTLNIFYKTPRHFLAIHTWNLCTR